MRSHVRLLALSRRGSAFRYYGDVVREPLKIPFAPQRDLYAPT